MKTKLLPTAADVAGIRGGLGLTQKDFADMIGISLRTLQGWEARRREPDGPSRVLLLVAKHEPDAITKALRAEAALR